MADTLLYRLANWLTGGELTNLRDYVLGQGAFTSFEQQYGRDKETFSPENYGNYIATSNAVYTCATIRAELLSSLPLRFYKLRDGQMTEVDAGKLWELFQTVNPYWTATRLLKMTSYALDLWGVAYWFLERGDTGRLPPAEIWWARPDRVKVVPHETEYIKGFKYTPPQSQNEIPFTPGEVVWMPNPNPIDEFSGLAPLAAARLGADLASAGMHSNMRIFEQGFMLGGLMTPPDDMEFTPEQAQELERNIDQRFAGQDKAHRIGVMRFKAEIDTPALTPSDAEYLDSLKWALEDVCRAYKIPLDLVGGQRTYQNFEAAMKAVWVNAVIPLAKFVADEITERMLPLFPNQADVAMFDISGVEILQEDRGEIVGQMKELWAMGVPLNPLLNEFMPHLLPESGAYPWGDVWWAPVSLLPVSSTAAAGGQEDAQPAGIRQLTRLVEYGSDEHERLWRKFERRVTRWERVMGAMIKDLFTRQKDSVLDRLKQPKRTIEDVINDPFDMAEWVKKFRLGLMPILREMMGVVGQEEFDDLGLALLFSVDAPEIVRFMEGRAQRFAIAVNTTTWDDISGSIAAGLQEGEGLVKIERRLTDLFNAYIDEPAVAEKMSRTEMIARTETVGAASGGSLEAWKQSGVVERKTWLAALDKRTRDTHIEAHSTYQSQPILLDEDFVVGLATGQGPGLMGRPEEDINCRCTMQPVVSERGILGSNGRAARVIQELENVKELLARI
jgi:HK97 family phage portal protein